MDKREAAKLIFSRHNNKPHLTWNDAISYYYLAYAGFFAFAEDAGNKQIEAKLEKHFKDGIELLEELNKIN